MEKSLNDDADRQIQADLMSDPLYAPPSGKTHHIRDIKKHGEERALLFDVHWM